MYKILEEFMEAFLASENELFVVCDNSAQRHEVVEIMLENGAWHGDSGESEKMFHDPSYATYKWMCVCNNGDGGLEYNTSISPHFESISGEEFLMLAKGTPAPQVDDLL